MMPLHVLLLWVTVVAVALPSCVVNGWIIQAPVQAPHYSGRPTGLVVPHLPSSGFGFRYRITSLQLSLSSRSSNSVTTNSTEASTQSSTTTTTTTTKAEPLLEFTIRPCKYGELSGAAHVIMKSFYNNTSPPWDHMYRLAELNRLQQNFPHFQPESHRMLVAVLQNQQQQTPMVIGFVDVDDRIPNQMPRGQPLSPRPYLSDLAVHPDHRRRGVARALVEACQEIVRDEWRHPALHIRVEAHNHAAIQMYQHRMGYQVEEWDEESATLLLKKEMNDQTQQTTDDDDQGEDL